MDHLHGIDILLMVLVVQIHKLWGVQVHHRSGTILQVHKSIPEGSRLSLFHRMDILVCDHQQGMLHHNSMGLRRRNPPLDTLLRRIEHLRLPQYRLADRRSMPLHPEVGNLKLLRCRLADSQYMPLRSRSGHMVPPRVFRLLSQPYLLGRSMLCEL